MKGVLSGSKEERQSHLYKNIPVVGILRFGSAERNRIFAAHMKKITWVAMIIISCVG